MATRSVVGYINKETGAVRAAYCHWDGYIKGGVGEELFDKFNSYESAVSLIDESPVYASIAGEIELMENCQEYEHYEFQNFEDFEDFIAEGADGTDYVYIFMQREAPAEWFVTRSGRIAWKSVSRALEFEGNYE